MKTVCNTKEESEILNEKIKLEENNCVNINIIKMIDNPNLNSKDRIATINMAIDKAKILQKGYIKHNRDNSDFSLRRK